MRYGGAFGSSVSFFILEIIVYFQMIMVYDLSMLKNSWTPVEEDSLAQMANEKKTIKEIATALSRSIRAVRMKAWRDGISIIRSKGGHGTSAGAKRRWAKSGSREALSKRMKEYWALRENKTAQSIRMTAVHGDPAKHANIVQGVRRHFTENPRPRSPKPVPLPTVDKRIAANQKRWADPEFQKKLRDGHVAYFSSPENREAHSRACRDARSRPEVIEKLRRVQREGSSIEKVLWGILAGLGFKEGVDWEKHFPIGPYQFDVLIRRPQGRHILVEVNGDYWHSLDRVRRVDESKRTYVERYHSDSHEVRTLWEHQFLAVGRVADTVRHWLGLTEINEFQFSDVVVKEIDLVTAKDFLSQYHYLGGVGRWGVGVGVFLGEELIAVIVFAHLSHKGVAGQWGLQNSQVRELSRMAIKTDRHVKNFGSWFLSRAVDLAWGLLPETSLFVSYADETYDHSGAIYKATNWIPDGEVRPDYWYVDSAGFVTGKKSLYKHASRMGQNEDDYAREMALVKVYGRRKFRFILRRP